MRLMQRYVLTDAQAYYKMTFMYYKMIFFAASRHLVAGLLRYDEQRCFRLSTG
jgi:hypothetical protein